jgi:hypothetical protein
MEERIRGQLVKLNSIHEKEAAQELMNGNGKAANEKINKGYPETWRRMRGTLISWHPHSLLLEQAQFLEQLLVMRGDLGHFPSRDLVLLQALVGAGSDVLGQLGPWRHGGFAVEQREKAGGWAYEVLEVLEVEEQR